MIFSTAFDDRILPCLRDVMLSSNQPVVILKNWAHLQPTTNLPIEQEYAESHFARFDRRQQWLFGRTVLREALLKSGVDAKDLPVLPDEYNRPQLQGEAPMTPSLSLSHTGEVFLAAVSWQGLIGVDVEAFPRPNFGRFRRIMTRWFDPHTISLIKEQFQNSDHSAELADLAAWSLAEATAKAMTPLSVFEAAKISWRHIGKIDENSALISPAKPFSAKVCVRLTSQTHKNQALTADVSLISLSDQLLTTAVVLFTACG